MRTYTVIYTVGYDLKYTSAQQFFFDKYATELEFACLIH